jgi:abequosyltransferase
MPLLSLCVPTFRRSQLLNQSLNAILSQIEPQMTDMVEVLVLDNASPDDTPSVVAQAQTAFPDVRLRSYRHPQNIGGDANFFEAVKLAQGKFVYLLSDDDILLPGAVARLLELIQAHPEFDAFSLNVRLFTENPYEDGTPQVYKLDEDQVLQRPDDALLLLKAHIIFLSCIAFRRDNIAGKDYDNRRGTNMGQSYLFLDALMPGRGIYFTSQPYIAQRTDNAVGYNFFRVWVTDFHSLMRHAVRIGYSSLVVQQIMTSNLRFLFHYTVIFKTTGKYGHLRPNYPDAIVRLLQTYRFNNYLWTRIIPVLLTPRFALGLLRKLYRNLKCLKRSPAIKNHIENLQQ